MTRARITHVLGSKTNQDCDMVEHMGPSSYAGSMARMVDDLVLRLYSLLRLENRGCR